MQLQTYLEQTWPDIWSVIEGMLKNIDEEYGVSVNFHDVTGISQVSNRSRQGSPSLRLSRRACSVVS